MLQKRKIEYLIEDVREYWLKRAGEWLVRTFVPLLYGLLYPVAYCMASVLPPRAKSRSEQVIGRFLWKARRFSVMREVLPIMRNMVFIQHCRPDGTIVMQDFGFNLRTNEGRDWQKNAMGAPTGRPAIANFIGVHNNSGYTPNATDTEASPWRTNELTANGFSRASGAYTGTPGSGAYTVSKTFTCTGSAVTGYGAGLLDTAPTGGSAFCIRNFGTPATLAPNDTLQVIWEITV